MPLPSPSTRSRQARPWVFLAGLTAAAIFGIAAAAPLCAQQPAAGSAPRRAAAPPQGQRAVAATAPAKRSGKGTATAAAATATRSRAKAGARPAASGVQQTSATVTAEGGVVLAGGATAIADCRQCGRQDCGKCRPAGGRLGLHCNGLCEQGGCPAHCPVRPDQFGYYATRWRSWPGQGVKQVGHFDPATTPVVPPRSEVPGMEEELALPSLQDEAPAEEEEDEEEEAMTDGEVDDAAKDDAAAGNAEPSGGDGGASGSEGGNPAGDSAADGEANEEGTAAGGKPATPPKADAPLDGLLDASGADASRPAAPATDGAWSNWSRASANERQPTPSGSVVRTSGPAETSEDARPSDDRRDGPKLRSPAQRMVEGSERAVGRWRAKASALGEAPAEAPANPLRGVTAQPGNPLR